MTAAQFAVESIPVDDVFITGERRAADDAAVKALVESIKAIGLQTPITVRGDDTITDPETGEVIGGYALVAGRHRLEAYRVLGHARIPAVVRECDEIDAGLWEVDENLCRSELTETEEARCLAKRKELWEARESRDRQAEQIVPPVKPRGHAQPKGFAAETASVTGETKQSVNRKVSRAEKIAPDVLDAITGGKWDKGVVLDLLKKLTHAEQRQALFRVKNGASHSFEDAYDFIRGDDPHAKPKPVPKPPVPLNDIETMDKWLASIMALWNRASPEWREEFLSRIKPPVMDSDDDLEIPAALRRYA